MLTQVRCGKAHRATPHQRWGWCFFGVLSLLWFAGAPAGGPSSRRIPPLRGRPPPGDGDYVSQTAVDAMVARGLQALTGTGSLSGAWEALIPGFQPGQKIAIKVNFNNALSEPPADGIDAIIEPVNALIGGLISFGFAAGDIYVYDVTHGWRDGRMSERFVNGCDSPGVHFVAWLGNPDPFSSTELVRFDPPSGSGITDRPLANVVVQADYLIKLPIAKVHPFSGVTLGFKNHLGSIDRGEYLHPYLTLDDPHYSAAYSPLVDLYGSATGGTGGRPRRSQQPAALRGPGGLGLRLDRHPGQRAAGPGGFR